jgi:hypothetical protein
MAGKIMGDERTAESFYHKDHSAADAATKDELPRKITKIAKKNNTMPGAGLCRVR